MADTERSMGGWVIAYCILIGALSPLGSAVRNYRGLYGDPAKADSFGAAWQAVQLQSWSCRALAWTLAWFVVWRLYRVRNWSSVRIAIAVTWFNAIGLYYVDAASLSVVARIPLGPMIDTWPSNRFGPLVFATLCTAYFLLSKRVAADYPRHPDAEGTARIFD
jgi:hypothetical protein